MKKIHDELSVHSLEYLDELAEELNLNCIEILEKLIIDFWTDKIYKPRERERQRQIEYEYHVKEVIGEIRSDIQDVQKNIDNAEKYMIDQNMVDVIAFDVIKKSGYCGDYISDEYRNMLICKYWSAGKEEQELLQKKVEEYKLYIWSGDDDCPSMDFVLAESQNPYKELKRLERRLERWT